MKLIKYAILLLPFVATTVMGQNIHDLAREGKIDSLRIVLSRSPEKCHETDARGFTPLHWASFSGHIDAAGILLSAGAQTDVVNAQGFTPLSMACYRGNINMISLLLNNHADPDLGGPMGKPMFNAALTGNLNIIDTLLGHNADIDCRGRNQWTPLFIAALRGNVEMASHLIQKGASVNLSDSEKRTPLHLAISNNQPQSKDVAEALLQAGAEVNVNDANGMTPAREALIKGRLDLFTTLLLKGAAINEHHSLTGRTLLHEAAISGFGDLAAELLKHNVEMQDVDTYGFTALDYAVRYGHTDLVITLKQAGAAHSELYAQKAKSPKAPVIKTGQAMVWRLSARGWAIKTAHHMLIFDNEYNGRQPDEPSLSNGFVTSRELSGSSVLALYTCYHAEPGTLEFIHAIETEIDQIHFIHYKGDAWRGNSQVTYLDGGGNIEIDGVKIHYYENADGGGMGWLNYMVEADNVTLYYGGFMPDSQEAYQKELDYFISLGLKCDLAFLQVAPGQESFISSALTALKPKAFFPKRAYWDPSQTELNALKSMIPNPESTSPAFYDNAGDSFYYNGSTLIGM